MHTFVSRITTAAYDVIYILLSVAFVHGSLPSAETKVLILRVASLSCMSLFYREREEGGCPGDLDKGDGDYISP
jgi:hypothetical protein